MEKKLDDNQKEIFNTAKKIADKQMKNTKKESLGCYEITCAKWTMQFVTPKDDQLLYYKIYDYIYQKCETIKKKGK